jgi:O-antigen/teichoic acid export membrane protein
VSVTSQIYTRLKRPLGTRLSGESLRSRVFRGGAWLGTGSVLEQAFRFGRSMALARLLAPEAFGLMAIIGSASSVLHTITDIGVKEALIRHPQGGEERYKAAAWWLAFGRSLGLYVIFFLLAPLMANFYGNPELSPLLRIVTLGVIFDGIYSSNAYIALKEMKFGKWAAMDHGGSICGVV